MNEDKIRAALENFNGAIGELHKDHPTGETWYSMYSLEPSTVETIRQALQSCLWNEMESAPRDVPVMLLFPADEGSKHEGHTPVCYWDAYYDEGGAGYTGGNGWVIAFAGEQVYLHFSSKPTAWKHIGGMGEE